jgi:hypothetical protein
MDQGHDEVDFFISYASADRAWAEWMAWQLDAAGYSVLLQAWDFRPGRDFMHEMQRATTTARRTIAVLSPDYFTSKFSEAEWRAIFVKDPTGEGGLLVPVRICDFQPTGLLATRVYVDLVGRDAIEARDALLRGIAERGARPTQEPSFPGSRRSQVEGPEFPGVKSSTRHWPVDDLGEVSPGHAVVVPGLHGGERFELPFGIAFPPSAYESLEELQDELFIGYLHSFVPPFSYGSEWILMRRFQILAPLEWIGNPQQSIHRMAPSWANATSLGDLQIAGGALLEVSGVGELRPHGVVSNDTRIIQALIDRPKAIALLDDYAFFSKQNAAQVDMSRYRFSLVLHDWLGKGWAGEILVDTGQKSLDDLDSVDRRYLL